MKDGPFRFWFNRDFEGSHGSYNEGREVGKWTECDRFGRCEEKNYPAIYPEEQPRPRRGSAGIFASVSDGLAQVMAFD